MKMTLSFLVMMIFVVACNASSTPSQSTPAAEVVKSETVKT